MCYTVSIFLLFKKVELVDDFYLDFSVASDWIFVGVVILF